jgi:hypothetical protein
MFSAEDWNTLEVIAGFIRIDSGHETSLAVRGIAAYTSVEGAGLAGDALSHHLRMSVDQDAHGS